MCADHSTGLGDYEILDTLGRGGMGTVYRARSTRLDRPVALKVLDPAASGDPNELARFKLEAHATSELNHPHIVQVFELGTGEAGGEQVHFIAMELVEGSSLRELLTGSTPLDEILEILAQVADALDVAHEKGLIHRDVKPENVLVTRDGYAKVVDFGIAKLSGSTDLRARDLGPSPQDTALTQAGEVMGTLAYMTPEQIRGDEVDRRTDVFALGNIIFEAVMGRAPFRRETGAATIRSIMSGAVPPIRNPRRLAPLSIERVIGRCLARAPEDRYASAQEVAHVLRSIRAEMEADPTTWVPVERIGLDRTYVVIAVTLIIVFLVMVLFLSRL